MTDEMIVERLAAFMGWGDGGFRDAWLASKAKGGEYINGRWVKMKRDFRPLTDHNHWREVECAARKDEELWGRFIEELDILCHAKAEIAIAMYSRIDLPTRCRALLAALAAVSSSL